MLFISIKHNTVLEYRQRGLVGNFTSSIRIILVVSKSKMPQAYHLW